MPEPLPPSSNQPPDVGEPENPHVRTEPSPIEIVFVRHGEPEWVRGGLNVDDPPLTERGQEQARRLAQRLAGEHFDEILVSPLQRTRQTAAPLLAAVGREQVLAPWLEEIRNPVWHGTPVERAEEMVRLKIYVGDKHPHSAVNAPKAK